MPGKIFIGADHTIDYNGVKGNGTIINTGACSWSLKGPAPALTEVGNGSVSYVAASAGNYRGLIDKSITDLLTVDKLYFLDITFSDFVTGYQDFRRVRLIAAHRSETD